jgi:hypothetical protein
MKGKKESLTQALPIPTGQPSLGFKAQNNPEVLGSTPVAHSATLGAFLPVAGRLACVCI